MRLVSLLLLAGATLVAPADGSARSFRRGGTPDSVYAWGAGVIAAHVLSGADAFDGIGGVGFQLVMERQFFDTFRWEARAGGFSTRIHEPAEIAYPAGGADYAILSGSVCRSLPRSGRHQWWLGAEGSLHDCRSKNFGYGASGLGLGPAFGVDLWSSEPGFPVFTRVGAHLNGLRLGSWYDDEPGNTFVALISVDVVYRLGRTRR